MDSQESRAEYPIYDNRGFTKELGMAVDKATVLEEALALLYIS